jgi:hypothetical protein
MNGTNRAHRAINHRSVMEQKAASGEQNRLKAADIVLFDAEGKAVAFFTYTAGCVKAEVNRAAEKMANENGWRMENGQVEGK